MDSGRNHLDHLTHRISASSPSNSFALRACSMQKWWGPRNRGKGMAIAFTVQRLSGEKKLLQMVVSHQQWRIVEEGKERKWFPCSFSRLFLEWQAERRPPALRRGHCGQALTDFFLRAVGTWCTSISAPTRRAVSFLKAHLHLAMRNQSPPIQSCFPFISIPSLQALASQKRCISGSASELWKDNQRNASHFIEHQWLWSLFACWVQHQHKKEQSLFHYSMTRIAADLQYVLQRD